MDVLINTMRGILSQCVCMCVYKITCCTLEISYRCCQLYFNKAERKETIEARYQGANISKELKVKTFQTRILDPAKLSFKNKGKINIFPDKRKLKKFTISRSSGKKC